MEQSEIKFTRNKFGIKIKQCCASCKHNVGIEGEDARLCDNGEGIVHKLSWCENWQIKTRLPEEKFSVGKIDLDVVGKGGGRVKKKQYLNFFLNYEQPEDRSKHVKKEVIREQFEKKYGSIYLNR